jgi:hypothetical protein
VTSSPNKPRPSDPLVIAVAGMIAQIERNYDREGSGPGSRFEGRLREDVQAVAVVAMVRDAVRQATAAALRRPHLAGPAQP